MNSFILFLALFFLISQLFIQVTKVLRQPRVMAEIFTGMLFAYVLARYGENFPLKVDWGIFSYLKELGLILLMFCSGAEIQDLNMRKNWKVSFLGVVIGIGFPAICGWTFFQFFSLESLNQIIPLLGPSSNFTKLQMIIILSAAVTSIPVISRILLDLKIFHTSFAEKILSIAIIEDFILYAMMNSVLQKTSEENHSILISVLIFALILVFRETIYRSLRFIVFKTSSESEDDYHYLTSIFGLLFLLVALLSHLGMTNMMSAFLAGIIISANPNVRVHRLISTIRTYSFAFFVPLYFIMVGFKIDLVNHFHLAFFLSFFLLSSLLKTLSGFITGRLSNHTSSYSWLMGVTLNARGGPGIVMATISYEQGLISPILFTTLIITALSTSSIAGIILQWKKQELL